MRADSSDTTHHHAPTRIQSTSLTKAPTIHHPPITSLIAHDSPQRDLPPPTMSPYPSTHITPLTHPPPARPPCPARLAVRGGSAWPPSWARPIPGPAPAPSDPPVSHTQGQIHHTEGQTRGETHHIHAKHIWPANDGHWLPPTLHHHHASHSLTGYTRAVMGRSFDCDHGAEMWLAMHDPSSSPRWPRVLG